ncbi:hypothetical protein PO883_16050 [Massilia sp. DJPM01]|uniref:hypothetical protein n=1 Tax=Massilia sp. DJPM01 TaxID=3024404 RepID=UPI00259E0087|nr:hypothetical protein [Massilia sp. DJPM01]MDM5178713.1 hypothetical protein [Massilia sp. DJPM01]
MTMNTCRFPSADSPVRSRLVRFIAMLLVVFSNPAVFAQATAAKACGADETAPGIVLYGQICHLQNSYANWTGGYLDVRDSGCNGNTLCVSTAEFDNRDRGSGSWMILPVNVSTKKGAPVIHGDHVYLVNQYPASTGSGDGAPGGYLDARGEGCQSNVLCVSTSLKKDTSVNSSSWMILPMDGVQSGKPVKLNQEINFQNRKTINGIHTYLDVRANTCQQNWLCVSTSVDANRDNGSGTWRFLGTVPSR